ncbi:MAG TPA: caspase family protein, partial [Longimicrobiales bacterium]|nr:caspase family protein [Longimicrobiales bacterium]
DGAATADADAARAPGRHALIIAIAEYPEPARLGYSVLNAHNDVPLIREALLRQGFADGDIRLLQDADADRAGILAAFRELVDRTREGDIVVIHYSGHGHRITDDDGDELDGYDEILVPWGAPASLDGGYAGELHIRDDEIAPILAELQNRIGPDGNILFILDSCFSGSATRGQYELPTRGMMEPLGPPRPVTSGGPAAPVQGSGFVPPALATRGVTGQDRDGLAPLVVISAARHDEVAREVRAPDGTPVGALSLALSRTLADVPPGTTYRGLYARVAEHMAAMVPLQTPQLEGDVDVQVFSGTSVAQAPHFRIREVRSADTVFIDGGTVVGLLPGTVVELHPSGTTDPATSQAIATGTVDRARPDMAGLVLDAPADRAALASSWAFVTRHSFGDMAVGVAVRDLDGDVASRSAGASLQQAIRGSGLLELEDEAPELVVTSATLPDGRPAVSLRRAVDDTPIGGAIAVNDATAVTVTERAAAYARTRYIKLMELADPDVKVTLEVVPSTLRFDDFDGSCHARDARPVAQAGGELRMAPGDGYVLRMRNDGKNEAYVAVLSLKPDGSMGQLFPGPRERGQDNLLPPGASFLVPYCYMVTEPHGKEVLKLFATPDRIDFEPLIGGGGTRAGGDRPSPLEQLFGEVHTGTRSETAALPRGTGTTTAVTIDVVPDHQ